MFANPFYDPNRNLTNKSSVGNQMLFDQEWDHSGLDDQSQSYIEEEKGRDSIKLQGFRNPYRAEVIAEAKEGDNPDLNNHKLRNTAKFEETNPFVVLEQNNHFTNNLYDLRGNFVVNEFDERHLPPSTEDTQDLSHLSISSFKNRFYKKDNNLYLDLTALNQSNISGIYRSGNQARDPQNRP